MSAKSLVLIPVALLVAAVFFSLAPFAQSTPPELPEISFDLALPASGTWDVEITSDHASKHGIEADTALRCLERQGPTLTYIEADKRTVHLFCLNSEDNKWYDTVVEIMEGGKRYVLKSAYMPKQGNWTEILKWLGRKGAAKWTQGPSIIRFFVP